MPSPRLTWQWRREGREGREGEGGPSHAISQTYLAMAEGGERGKGDHLPDLLGNGGWRGEREGRGRGDHLPG